jgi:hypothetical protein
MSNANKFTESCRDVGKFVGFEILAKNADISNGFESSSPPAALIILTFSGFSASAPAQTHVPNH